MTDVTAQTTIEETPYFPVSLWKLTVMTVSTLCVYQLWWFYKNWYRVKRREQADISPAWRAIFAIFWCYACFARIRSSAETEKLDVWLPAGPLAVAWIIAGFLSYLPDPFYLLAYASVVFLFPAQTAANRLNRAMAPGHDQNRHFKGWNWVAIAMGMPLNFWVIWLAAFPET